MDIALILSPFSILNSIYLEKLYKAIPPVILGIETQYVRSFHRTHYVTCSTRLSKIKSLV